MTDRLPDTLESNARVKVLVDGIEVGTRRAVNFIGATATDDSTNEKVNITPGGSVGAGTWHIEPNSGLPILHPTVSYPTVVSAMLTPDPFPTETTYVRAFDNGGANLDTSVSIDIQSRGDGNETFGRDSNLTTTQDVNWNIGRDINVSAVRDTSFFSTGDLYLTAGGTINFSPALDTLLADTGVSPAVYGGAGVDMQLTVDAKGRITAISNASSTPVTHKPAYTIFNHSADGGNGTTVETDLYSDTLVASLLAANGDKIEYRVGGTFVSSATATRQLKLYFGGTAIFDTGTLTISSAASWDLEALFIRVSSSVVRYTVKLNTEFAALSAYTAVGELTGLTLANTQVLKVTGQAAGVGAATNDIVAKLGSGMFWPAV